MVRIVNHIDYRFREQGLAGLNAGVGELNKSMTRLGQSSASAGRAFSSQSQGLGGFVAAYAGAAATVYALSAAYDVLAKAAQNEQLIQGSRTLATVIGEDSRTIISSIQAITKGQLSMVESAQAANQALAAGFGAETVERLVNVASKASRALGRDLTDSIQRLTRGAIKLEPELLDELGIFTRINPALEKYAQQNNRSVATLTQFERRQAFMNAILEEGELRYRAIDTASSSAQTSFARLSAALQDLGLKFANVVLPVFASIADFISGSGSNSIAAGMLILALTFKKANELIANSFTKVDAALERGLSRLRERFTDQKKFADEMKSLQEAVGPGKINTSDIGNKGIRDLVTLAREGQLSLSQFVLLNRALGQEIQNLNTKVAPLKAIDDAYNKATEEAATFEKSQRTIAQTMRQVNAQMTAAGKSISFSADAYERIAFLSQKLAKAPAAAGGGPGAVSQGIFAQFQRGAIAGNENTALQLNDTTRELKAQNDILAARRNHLESLSKLTIRQQNELKKLNEIEQQRNTIIEIINKKLGTQAEKIQQSIHNAATRLQSLKLPGIEGADALKSVTSKIASGAVSDISNNTAQLLQNTVGSAVEQIKQKISDLRSSAEPLSKADKAILRQHQADLKALEIAYKQTKIAATALKVETSLLAKTFNAAGTAASFLGKALNKAFAAVSNVLLFVSVAQIVLDIFGEIFGFDTSILGTIADFFSEMREEAKKTQQAFAAVFNVTQGKSFEEQLKRIGLEEREITDAIQEQQQALRKNFQTALSEENKNAALVARRQQALGRTGNFDANGNADPAFDRIAKIARANARSVTQAYAELADAKKALDSVLANTNATVEDVQAKQLAVIQAETLVDAYNKLGPAAFQVSEAIKSIADLTGYDVNLVAQLVNTDALKKIGEAGLQVGDVFIKEFFHAATGTSALKGGFAQLGAAAGAVAQVEFKNVLDKYARGSLSSEEAAKSVEFFRNNIQKQTDDLFARNKALLQYNQLVAQGKNDEKDDRNAEKNREAIAEIEALRKQTQGWLERADAIQKNIFLQERMRKGLQDTFGQEIKIAEQADLLGIISTRSGEVALEGAGQRVNQLENAIDRVKDGLRALDTLNTEGPFSPEDLGLFNQQIDTGKTAAKALSGAFFQTYQAIELGVLEQEKQLALSIRQLQVTKAQAAITLAEARIRQRDTRLQLEAQAREANINILEKQLELLQAQLGKQDALNNAVREQVELEKTLLDSQLALEDAYADFIDARQERIGAMVLRPLEEALDRMDRLPNFFTDRNRTNTELELAKLQHQLEMEALDREEANLDRRYNILFEQARLDIKAAEANTKAAQDKLDSIDKTFDLEEKIRIARNADEIAKIEADRVRLAGERELLGLRAALDAAQYELDVEKLDQEKKQAEIKLDYLEAEALVFADFVAGNKEWVSEFAQLLGKEPQFSKELADRLDPEKMKARFDKLRLDFDTSFGLQREGLDVAYGAQQGASNTALETLKEQDAALNDLIAKTKERQELERQIAIENNKVKKAELTAALASAKAAENAAVNKLTELEYNKMAEEERIEAERERLDFELKLKEDAAKDANNTLLQLAHGLVGGLKKNFADFLTELSEDVLNGTKSIKDAFNDMLIEILQGIQRQVTQQLIVGPIMDAVGAGLGWLTGGGAAASGAPAGAAAGVQAGTPSFFGWGYGGMIGGLVPQHFAGGGRMGRGRDRIPAMLEPGEFVIRKPMVDSIGVNNLNNMNAHGMTAPQVNVINQGTAQEPAKQPEVKFDGEKYVVDIVLRDLNNNGPIRRGLRGQR